MSDNIEIEDKTILGELRKGIVSLSEIDQDCAVLDELYVERSQRNVLARIEEVIGHLMIMRETVKMLKVESYKDSKYKDLIKIKKQ